ncbi:phosphopantetheine-binding protein [Pseudomonas aeruginosa]
MSQQAYRAPGSELEQRIAAIWAEILGVERVGLDDNFFELGGHSLLLLMLKERIGDTCQATLSISQLMTHASVAEQAACIEGQARESLLVPLNGRREGCRCSCSIRVSALCTVTRPSPWRCGIVIRSRVLSAVPCAGRWSRGAR